MTEETGPVLSRRMIERAVTACEGLPFAESHALVALLNRFEAEAAREEARLLARSLATEAAVAAVLDSIPAALIESYRQDRLRIAA